MGSVGTGAGGSVSADDVTATVTSWRGCSGSTVADIGEDGGRGGDC